MTQRESRLSQQINTALRKQGAWCFKVHGGPMTMAGVPDIIGCWQGRFFGVETKISTRVTTRQAYVHGKIRDAGGVVIVAHSVSEAVASLIEALRSPVPAWQTPGGTGTPDDPH